MLIVEPFKSNSYGGVAKTPAGAWERNIRLGNHVLSKFMVIISLV